MEIFLLKKKIFPEAQYVKIDQSEAAQIERRLQTC
jgi:hypothetical protein